MLKIRMLWSVPFVFASTLVFASSVNDVCLGAASGQKKNQFMIEVSKGEMMVTSRLADLDAPDARFQCGLGRWSEPEMGEATIVAVVNSDRNQILGQTNVTLKTTGDAKAISGDPQDIGPGNVALFLLASNIGALEVETTVNGQKYVSASRTLADNCPLKKLGDAIEGLKLLTTTDDAKLELLSRHNSPKVRTIAVFVEDVSLDDQSKVLELEWDKERSDGLGCLQ